MLKTDEHRSVTFITADVAVKVLKRIGDKTILTFKSVLLYIYAAMQVNTKIIKHLSKYTKYNILYELI